MTSRNSFTVLALFAALSCAIGPVAFADSAVATLEERMSQRDFDASGLGKLSATELAHLNAWLGARSVMPGASGGLSAEPTFYPKDSARQAITSHLVGAFEGWRGKTKFTLDNGQVWQQAESGTFGNIQITDPEVRIKPLSMGSWLMYVDGCGCSVRVKRIE